MGHGDTVQTEDVLFAETQLALLKEELPFGRIPINDEIGPRSEKQARAFLTILESARTPVILLIDSPGGYSESCGILTDAIEAAKVPVLGVAVGMACSTAFALLQHCHRRFALPHARMMYHGGSIQGMRIDTPGFYRGVAFLRRRHRTELEHLSQRTGQSIARWRKWSREERFFSSEEALQLGIIDKIIARAEDATM